VISGRAAAAAGNLRPEAHALSLPPLNAPPPPSSSPKPPPTHPTPTPQVYHVLNSAPKGWSGGSGFITKDILRSRLPAPADDVMVLRCGPKPMNDAMKGYLDEIGYPEAAQFEF